MKKAFKHFSLKTDILSIEIVNYFIDREKISEKVKNEMKWSKYQSDWIYLQRQIDYLNARSSTITTHISIMIAVSLIALTITSGNSFEQIIILFEIILYLLVAVLSLRNLLPVNVYSKIEDGDHYVEYLPLERG